MEMSSLVCLHSNGRLNFHRSLTRRKSLVKLLTPNDFSHGVHKKRFLEGLSCLRLLSQLKTNEIVQFASLVSLVPCHTSDCNHAPRPNIHLP